MTVVPQPALKRTKAVALENAQFRRMSIAWNKRRGPPVSRPKRKARKAKKRRKAKPKTKKWIPRKKYLAQRRKKRKRY